MKCPMIIFCLVSFIRIRSVGFLSQVEIRQDI